MVENSSGFAYPALRIAFIIITLALLCLFGTHEYYEVQEQIKEFYDEIEKAPCNNTAILYISRSKYFFCPITPSAAAEAAAERAEAGLAAARAANQPSESSDTSAAGDEQEEPEPPRDGCDEAWEWFTDASGGGGDGGNGGGGDGGNTGEEPTSGRRGRKLPQTRRRAKRTTADYDANDPSGVDFDDRNPSTYPSTSTRASSIPRRERGKNCKAEWVTYSTFSAVGLNRLADVTSMIDLPLSVVGLHQPWNGFRPRLVAVLEYVQSLPPDRIIIATDALDVTPVPSCTADRIISAFLSFNAPIVFGAEPYCFPDRLEDKYPPLPPEAAAVDSQFKYLNAGTYVGYAWAVIAALKAALANPVSWFDDQREYTRLFLNQTQLLPFISRWEDEQQRSLRWRLRREWRFDDKIWKWRRVVKTMQARLAARPVIVLDHMNGLIQNLLGTKDEDYEIVDLRDVQQQQLQDWQQQQQRGEEPNNPSGGGGGGGGGGGSISGRQAQPFPPLLPLTPLPRWPPALHLGLRNRNTGGFPCLLHEQGEKFNISLPVLQLLIKLQIDEARAGKGYISWWRAGWLHRVGKYKI
ncbi:hypothetical protein CLOM_g14674 [Closterium sp. NIES-68]|nr:hypothetical protein CLOM_g14674 [Closterium sp. NIES-68]GJP81712.1 hypothetical protein CLOP_g11849 [Closterium sp. NIES-67]